MVINKHCIYIYVKRKNYFNCGNTLVKQRIIPQPSLDFQKATIGEPMRLIETVSEVEAKL